MSMTEQFKSDAYPDGRTKQAFKDSCDINQILALANRGNTITHLAKYEAVYGDFSDIDDLLDATNKLERGNQIFRELPGEVKREFNNDAATFFRFVNDPANTGRLLELVPGLAKPGNDLPEPRRTAQGAQRAQDAADAAAARQTPPEAGGNPPADPPAGAQPVAST